MVWQMRFRGNTAQKMNTFEGSDDEVLKKVAELIKQQKELRITLKSR